MTEFMKGNRENENGRKTDFQNNLSTIIENLALGRPITYGDPGYNWFLNVVGEVYAYAFDATKLLKDAEHTDEFETMFHTSVHQHFEHLFKLKRQQNNDRSIVTLFILRNEKEILKEIIKKSQIVIDVLVEQHSSKKNEVYRPPRQVRQRRKRKSNNRFSGDKNRSHQ